MVSEDYTFAINPNEIQPHQDFRLSISPLTVTSTPSISSDDEDFFDETKQITQEDLVKIINLVGKSSLNSQSAESDDTNFSSVNDSEEDTKPMMLRSSRKVSRIRFKAATISPRPKLRKRLNSSSEKKSNFFFFLMKYY
jgi:hypothetical protein